MGGDVDQDACLPGEGRGEGTRSACLHLNFFLEWSCSGVEWS